MYQREQVVGEHARRWFARVTVVLCVFTIGCSNSRYGISYDERLPTIKRVAIYPASINVVSLHTGGLEEGRPDLEPDVATRCCVKRSATSSLVLLSSRACQINVVSKPNP